MATVGQNKGIYYGFRKANETARIFGFLLLYFGSTNVCFTFVNLSNIQALLPNKFDIGTISFMAALPVCSLTFCAAIECPVTAGTSLGWSRFGTSWCVTLNVLSSNWGSLLCCHTILDQRDTFVGTSIICVGVR